MYHNIISLLRSLIFILVIRRSICDLQPVVVASSFAGGSLTGPSRCEEVRIPMCRGIGYNMTSMPNDFNQDNQEEAGLEVHQFYPLVEIHCSVDLKFFLCSMYAPICIEDYDKPLKACKSVCERAKSGCEPLMRMYNFRWPDRLNCDNFPVAGKEVLCMEPPDSGYITSQNENNYSGRVTKRPEVEKSDKCKHGKKGKDCVETLDIGVLKIVNNTLIHKSCEPCRCRSPLIDIDRDSPWYNRSVSVGGENNCAFPCGGVFFSEDEKQFITSWITIWAGLCCAATLMTITTFLIDTERFKYPERPIVFLSGCYFLVSVGYLIRISLGHEAVACENRMIVHSASGPTPCILVFLLIYFFGMASSIWWVILTLTWFLAAGFKWSNEAIASYSQYFHLAAWLLPTIKTVGVLITSAVDGDPVSGICYVGNQNPYNLQRFVLIPLVIYLIFGMSFLFVGFISLFRIRSVIKKQGLGGRTKTDKLEKLMIRIGIFSVLYTLPATVLIACYFYESSLYTDWMKQIVCPCHEKTYQHSVKFRPIYAVVILKYFMALVVGITSGVWIWSGKTIGSWKKLSNHLFRTSSNKDRKHNLINNSNKARVVVKQQYLVPPSIPVPPIPASSSSILSSSHMTPTGLPGLIAGHHHSNNMVAGGFHHHMIKQSQQAPLSHV